jgi:hypothetical protein
VATNDSFTLETLRDFVTRAGDFHDPAFPDTLKDYWINAAISAWVDFVFEMDDTRFLKEGTIAVSAGTDTYDLKDSGILAADDYYRARGFAVTDSGSPSGYTRLEKFEWAQRHDYSYSSERRAALWDVQGDKLYIWPVPTWSAATLLEYFPLPAKLVNTSDAVDLRNHVSFVITYVCMHLCPKDESSLRDWERLHERARADIRSASPQNRAETKKAVSIYGTRHRLRHQRRMTRLT